MLKVETNVSQDVQEPELSFGSSIITRREVMLLRKACHILKSYEKSSDCKTAVIDRNGHSVPKSDCENTAVFCDICKKYYEPLNFCGKNERSCMKMHTNSISKARRMGGPYIYMCDMGFIYWISPVYSMSRYAGALVAGWVLAMPRQHVMEKINAFIPEEETRQYLEEIPEKTSGEIKALAQLLLVCAELISGISEDFAGGLRSLPGYENRLRLKTVGAQAAPRPVREKMDPCYPLDKERLLLASLRRGDNDTGKKILNELLESILKANPGNFEYIRFRIIELVVLLSRASVTPDITEDNSILENNNRYLKRIQESRTIEELWGNLHLIIDHMAGKIFSFQGVRHASALRKAERFIWENYTRKISLQEIAAASGLSSPYFSTIFKEEMGENLSSYLNRLRVEKASAMLTETSQSLNEIAQVCGFEDQSWFSKIFKGYTGTSPGKYREQGGGPIRHNRDLVLMQS